MNSLATRIICTLLAGFCIAASTPATAQSKSGNKKLKVYILAGQSNMEGHAAISTFDYVGLDPKTRPMLDKMRDDTGQPAVADKVWISYYTGHHSGSDPGELTGKLTAGYGAVGPGKKVGSKIGPEYLFGLTMREQYDGPILIIKTAWGGKSLHTDFRPPSAGPYEYPRETLEAWSKHPQGAHGVPAQKDIPKRLAEVREKSGKFYRLMIDHVKQVLADPKRVVPDYDAAAGYEVAGFVWFQGWNDMVDRNTYPRQGEPDRFVEYTRLLACLIQDVRQEVKTPDLPVVVGVIGVGGEKQTGGITNLARAMHAIENVKELGGNVTAVATAPFWDERMASLEPKKKQIHGIMQSAYLTGDDGLMYDPLPGERGWQPIGKPAPSERSWRFYAFDPINEKDELKKSEQRRFRDVSLPDGIEGWQQPGFDDSAWSAGKAPIGTGVWKVRGVTEPVKYQTDWGGKEFILMRSEFELTRDEAQLAAYRLIILNKQGFRVFLNGEKIEQYVWWQDARYRPIPLDDKHAALLKPGQNVLAVDTWASYDKRSGEAFNAVNAWIEGITQDDLDYVNSEAYQRKRMRTVATDEEIDIISGMSNGGFHYLGSAKIMAQIGEAFAEAMIELEEE